MRSIGAGRLEGDLSACLERALERAASVVVGKPEVLRMALACILARGHLLIEDVPGVGKTTLAHTLACTLGMSFQRIQFTSDLLPADILGASVLEPSGREFRFHPGPIFAQLVLCDEVNRASPKTQSALLEAMEEGQITHDGTTHPLPSPFFVATQNPERQVGTFPLPESQLDRFLMRLHMGYPDREAERALLRGEDRRRLLRELKPALTPQELLDAQGAVDAVHASDALVDYLQLLLEHTRSGAGLHPGLSPRAGRALLQAARAWALLDGRPHLLPEDLQVVFASVAGHRLVDRDGRGLDPQRLQAMVREVPVP